VPPYTFVATVNAVLLFGAMPVFVDIDPATFQIDHDKIEAAITERTVAIVPVHLGGGSVDLDGVLSVAGKHKLPVIEDACQSHLAEWKGRKVGSYGMTGCFSFQASKNLNCGEGGAIITSDDALKEKAYAFHTNNGRGANLRLTDLQASLLLAQMTRIEQQAKTREANAQYLTQLLRGIPGIKPAATARGCTRNAYHLYMYRYDGANFADLQRAHFLKALSAEGIPASGGYKPLNLEPFLKSAFTSRGGSRVYSKERVRAWEERNRMPENDKLCTEAVWFTQNMLLGTKSDMEEIAGAIRRIQKHAPEVRSKLSA
jgi:perosamine synthetase